MLELNEGNNCTAATASVFVGVRGRTRSCLLLDTQGSLGDRTLLGYRAVPPLLAGARTPGTVAVSPAQVTLTP